MLTLPQTIVDTTVYWPENKVNTMLYNPHRKAIITASTKLKQWKFASKEVVGVCPIVQVSHDSGLFGSVRRQGKHTRAYSLSAFLRAKTGRGLTNDSGVSSHGNRRISASGLFVSRADGRCD